DRISRRNKQRRHSCKELIISGERPDLSAKFSYVIERRVVCLCFSHEPHTLSTKRQTHGYPDIIENYIVRKWCEVCAPHHGDWSRHADQATELRFLATYPVFIAPVRPASGLAFYNKIARRAAASGVLQGCCQSTDGSGGERLPNIVEQEKL